MANNLADDAASGSGGVSHSVGISNSVHSEVAPCLPLASVPVFCGALDQELKLFDESRSSNRSDVVSCAAKIADLLRNTDVSYLNLRTNGDYEPYNSVGYLDIHDEVLRHNAEAFDCGAPGPSNGHINIVGLSESMPFANNISTSDHVHTDTLGTQNQQHDDDVINHSRKPKVRKKGKDSMPSSSGLDDIERQDDVVGSFCETMEDLCGRAEIVGDDRDEAEWVPLTLADLKMVVNEVVSVRSKKMLHRVPLDTLTRLLRVLDHQVHRAEGLSVIDCDSADSDVISSVCAALEAIHATLDIMTSNGMPKQLYKEEIIERIVEFSRHQILDIMAAFDPAYRALHRPNENGILQDDEDDDEEDDEDFGSASKKRRTTSRNVKVRKSKTNRTSASVNGILQKLCSIVGFLEELLSLEHLPDSCILPLVRTSFTTLLVDNINILQLKAINLISKVFYSYKQHRAYVMDEALQVLLKLPFSKRVPRTYHLPDEEQKQIQIVSALIIQLIHCSANVPEALRKSCGTPSLDVSTDESYPTKCYEAVTESCCLFWSRVLQRLTGSKNQESSELKLLIENIVVDLLATLNLPEYPASAPILEVLCVLLLQNAGLKSKDIAARSLAIDLLGTIAARLKHDAVVSRKEKYWIVQELISGESSSHGEKCSVCHDARGDKPLFVCQGCKRLLHFDCNIVEGNEVSDESPYCHYCLCKKQLLALRAYCETQGMDDEKRNRNSRKKSSSRSDEVSNLEIVQQLLLNYLQDTGGADFHLFTCWFYLCLWFKDDPDSHKKLIYYVARLKSKVVLRDSSSASTLLKREAVKKLSLALGHNSSFFRGLDKILQVLLASLRENSPVIRAKALRAVSIIVEADPEVLGEKFVQTAVEGRFCDSAISVREAALELVGRHIASYPDVGLKYFEKVAERVKDTGVSVRKRAIKIIRDMCIANSDFTDFTDACMHILSRVTDEESSIQDLVCKTFYEFWFEEPSSVQGHHFGDGSSVPLEIAKKTEQIVEMLRRLPSHQLLVVVIKRNLNLDFFPQSAKAAGVNPMSRASVRKRCELMCKCLLEKILQVTETSTEEGGEVQMLPYMLLLHAFCVVDPFLCAPSSDPSQFIVTLQPYLKNQADSRVAAQLLESILFVIDSVLPLIRKLPHSLLEELEQDMKQIIVRHSFLTVVHACIKCLCSVCKVAGKGVTVVEYLIQLVLKHLESLQFDNYKQIGRSLFCLGVLIRYGSSLPAAPGFYSKGVDVTSSLNLFKKYLQAEDFSVKARSLQALGYVLIAKPECMLEKDVGKILEATLSPNADIRLKMQSLQNMYEYLLDAESQMEAADKANQEGADTHAANGGHSVTDAAGAGDTNICGGIVQLYWSNILGRSLDVNAQVRQSVLRIVEVVLRQGLVHPITCVPYLIALETDPQEANTKLAHHLLMNMNEKYPAFFESRLGDGLQMSYAFMQCLAVVDGMPRDSSNVKGKSETSSLAYARLGVSRIYKLIRGNRNSRNKFMHSIVRKFDGQIWNQSVIQFLIYCAEILSMLPFALPDEPLYLIYSINRIIQVRSGSLEANMKACLQLLQEDAEKVNTNGISFPQSSTLPDCNDEQMNDVKQEATDGNDEQTNNVNQEATQVDLNDNEAPPIPDGLNAKFPNHTIKKVIPEEYLQKIQVACLAAGALQLLIKLKRHLKIVYSLDDERCQAFSPNEPLKTGEYLSRQNIPFKCDELSVDLPTTYDSFLQRYQDFKNALREDTVDYSIYSANIKKKRPPPPRKITSAVKPVRTVVRGGGDDSDDDDDDEDWGSGGGGGRRHSNTSTPQKGYNIKTRQRV